MPMQRERYPRDWDDAGSFGVRCLGCGAETVFRGSDWAASAALAAWNGRRGA